MWRDWSVKITSALTYREHTIHPVSWIYLCNVSAFIHINSALLSRTNLVPRKSIEEFNIHAASRSYIRTRIFWRRLITQTTFDLFHIRRYLGSREAAHYFHISLSPIYVASNFLLIARARRLDATEANCRRERPFVQYFAGRSKTILWLVKRNVGGDTPPGVPKRLSPGLVKSPSRFLRDLSKTLQPRALQCERRLLERHKRFLRSCTCSRGDINRARMPLGSLLNREQNGPRVDITSL